MKNVSNLGIISLMNEYRELGEHYNELNSYFDETPLYEMIRWRRSAILEKVAGLEILNSIEMV